ncbi:flagellar biosynthetic protein FliO [Piscinibacter sp.]|uniref:flagellar biosynthetic protein FliO n=1 Tax=Piscinibacter sp. TaxID=1903157 RepID=UPI002C135B0E|nr:flagellar biosynthetic protein FliO [Albitalea sp.]HUG22593.1 flagellar biosynthetic protein FliO [Albitalea sp.]
MNANTAASQAAAEPVSAMPNLATQMLSTAVALVVVLALAWVLLRALKRLQSGRAGAAGSGDVPQVLRSVGLGPRERLVTVRYRGREYLLGVTAGAISVVDSHEAAEPGAGTAIGAARADPS